MDVISVQFCMPFVLVVSPILALGYLSYIRITQ